MWTCPKCERLFKTTNQSHMCVKKDIGELFVGKSDELVLAFDAIYQAVMDWNPNVASASIHAAVFTSKKAWLIIKPMKSELDVKFYHDQLISSDLVKKTSKMGKKHAHHIRINNEFQVTRECIDLLKIGYDFSLQ